MAFNGTIEINGAVRSDAYGANRINQKSPLVEIFACMAQGRELSTLNGKLKDSSGRALGNADKGADYIRDLAFQAGGGNAYAAHELNQVRSFAIWPLLQEEIRLLGWMGSYTPLGYNDSVFAEVRRLNGQKSRVQAMSGDVTFPAWEYDKYPVPTVDISGGYVVDYRKLEFGDMTDENIGMQQVRTDIRNKAATYVIYKIWDSVSKAKGPKFVAQGAGVTFAALNDIVRSIRRFGSVGIFGDYAMVSQINQFAGFAAVTPVLPLSGGSSQTVGGVSEAAMEEIRRTGLIGAFGGATVMEIKNDFDLSRPVLDAGGNPVTFETYMPNSLMFVIPQGMQSPVRTWTRGGLTSMIGSDVASGRVMCRFDLSVA